MVLTTSLFFLPSSNKQSLSGRTIAIIIEIIKHILLFPTGHGTMHLFTNLFLFKIKNATELIGLFFQGISFLSVDVLL